MVAIRLHRLGVESLHVSEPQVAVQRISVEVGAEQTGAGQVRLHRLGVEVLCKKPTIAGVQRIAVEAGVPQTGAGQVRLHRLGVEVLLRNAVALGVQRVAFETGATQGGSGSMRLHRLGVEVLAKTGVIRPVPRTLAANLDFFLHNWATELEIETAYSTDVLRSPYTLAEVRTSNFQRPERTMRVRWSRMGRAEIDRLRVLLRRMTDEGVQIPLYCDATRLTANLSNVGTTVFASIGLRRFHAGARVLFFRTASTYISYTDALVATISTVAAESFDISAALGTALTAGEWSVVPLIDCDEVLDPEVTNETAEVGDVTLTVREFRGPNALPPLSIGAPSSFGTLLGRPVFEIEPNWIDGITTTYRRAGQVARIGRRQVPIKEGPRYQQEQDWALAPVVRADWYAIASMFDSRRGRGEAFWAIDREHNWRVALTSSVFIDIEPLGRFADFNQVWTESGIVAAIKLKDGRVFGFQVNTVQDNGSAWRLTAVGGQTLPTINLADIDFFARGRLTRFDTDAMRETWKTDEVCDVRLSTIELLNEKTVDYDA